MNRRLLAATFSSTLLGLATLSGCGPENAQTQQPPADIQAGQQEAAIGPNQNWLTTYYSDAAKTKVIGAYDHCPPGSSWGSTSNYSTNTVITCVGGSTVAP